MTASYTDPKGAQLTIDGRRLIVVQRGECRDVAVTVDLPEDAGKRAELAAVLSLPEPEITPGTTGWATVRIAPFPAQRNRGIVALNDDGDPWLYYADQNGYAGGIDVDRITDFVSDAAVRSPSMPEITIEQRDPILDVPLAWAIARAGVDHTDPRCSYVRTEGALLCDCGAVEKAFAARLQEYRAVAETVPMLRKRANERDSGRIAELTEDERKALPAVHHRPHWDGLGEPHSWICTACWGEGWTSQWPCEVATAGGRELAQHLGLEFSW